MSNPFIDENNNIISRYIAGSYKKMADRQRNHHAQEAQRNYEHRKGLIRHHRRNAKILIGAGAAMGVAGAISGLTDISPYRGNADVQTYRGLKSRADSLRGNLECFREDGKAIHPILRTFVDKDMAAEMKTELGGVETQMASLGVIPDVMKYKEWSHKNPNIPSSFILGGLTLIMVGAYEASKGRTLNKSTYHPQPATKTE